MKDTDKFKWGIGIVTGLFWIVLLVMKTTSEISLKVPFWISVGISVIFIISLFFDQFKILKDRLKEKEKDPEPISEKELKERHQRIIKEAGNYIIKGKIPETKSATVNENIIYYTKYTLYRPVDLGDTKTNEIVILDNATFPQMRSQVLPFIRDKEEMKPELLDMMNKMSKNWTSPDVHETEEMVDPFGKPIRKTKVTSFAKKEEKKEEDEAVV